MIHHLMVAAKIFPIGTTTTKPLEKDDKASFPKPPSKDQEKSDKKNDKVDYKGHNKLSPEELARHQK